MADVLINSLVFLVGLSGLLWGIVRLRARLQGRPFTALPHILANGGNSRPVDFRVLRRVHLGWKSSAVDLTWEGRRYLLVVHESDCVVIDKMIPADSTVTDPVINGPEVA